MSSLTSTRKHNHHNYYTKKSFTKEEWRQKVLHDKLVTNEPVFERLRKSGAFIGTEFNGIDNIDSLSNSNVGDVTAAAALNASDSVSNVDSYMSIAVNEPSIPGLLMNYFVTMGYVEASLEMARELGLVVTNDDAVTFNELYKVRERFEISKLIKCGRAGAAMEMIIRVFGADVLEELDTEMDTRFFGTTTATVKDRPCDLHFKLLLMNLIEMIRNRHTTSGEAEIVDEKFILDIIKYSQEKLAVRAAANPKYMKDMELIMTLLLLPPGFDIRQLPANIRQLYSISLRTRIADQVNKRLLDYIYPNIANQTRFPDLICPNNVNRRKTRQFGPILRTGLSSLNQSESKKSTATTRPGSSNKKSLPEPQLASRTSRSTYWARSVASLRRMRDEEEGEEGEGEGEERESKQRQGQKQRDTRQQEATDDSSENNEDDDEKGANFLGTKDIDANDLLYEANLVQVMKLWSWCENQLHSKGIGVPRVENGV